MDSHRALQFAIDVAKGMAYLHSLDRNMPRFHLNSKHVMVSPKGKQDSLYQQSVSHISIAVRILNFSFFYAG